MGMQMICNRCEEVRVYRGRGVKADNVHKCYGCGRTNCKGCMTECKSCGNGTCDECKEYISVVAGNICECVRDV